MPDAEVRLAKLSRPRVGSALARERLFASLGRLRERPVVWIAAQPGAGKTTLLSSYVEARKVPSIWYQVDGGDSDPASFFYHLGIAAQSLKRARREAPALPLLAPEHRADLPAFARRYFRDLYARMGRGSALVLDNLHQVEETQPLHRVLATAFEEVPETVGVLVASRGEPPGAYAPLIARERFAFVDGGEIRLTLEETGEIAHHRADLDSALVRKLHEQSDGWAAGLTLLIERARRGGAIDGRHDPGALQHVFAYFAEQLLAHDFRADTERLLQLAFMPRMTAAMAAGLTGEPSAVAVLEKLHRRHLFTERRVTREGPCYEFHALLRAYLQHRASESWTAEKRREVMARAAGVLEAGCAPNEAIPLYRELEDWGGVARVALGEAQALVAQGRNQTLIECLATLPEPLKDAQPRVRYWLGSALATMRPRDARSELVRAHEGFARAGERLGRILAAAGIIYSHYLDLSQLREMDPWIEELNAELEAGMRFPTPAMELHVRAALLFALDFRRPDTKRILACVERMFELIDDPGIASNDKVASAAILLFDCFHHGDVESGVRLVALVERMLAAPAIAPAARALWWIQVGYFSLTRGELAAAARAFEASVRVCADNGLTIPIIDVYSQYGHAFAAIFAGDLARAEAHRARADVHYKTFRRVDIAASAMFKGVLASHRGDFDAAREFSREHFDVADEAGIQWQAHNALLHRAFVACEQGRFDDARAFTRRARDLVDGTIYDRFTYQGELLDAFGYLLAGDRARMRAKLGDGLAHGRWDPAKFFLRLQPRLLQRLLAAALAEGIEADTVRRTIRELRIAPPAQDAADWPWPLAIRTLGRFEVQRDAAPLEFSRKAPRKTLQLLKAIIAAGGTNVPEAVLLEALWPDEEGDAAAKSLGAAVLRLRALLGDNEAVIQQAGTLSLDRNRTWVDAWAFEESGRLDLYKGSFLAEEEGVPWPVAARERLRGRFIQAVGEQGAALEAAGRFTDAIALYLRGLEADGIIEPFYQGLMRCYHRLDRRAEAAAAYRRLRQILSVTLGLAPSATTEKLFRSLHLSREVESVGDK